MRRLPVPGIDPAWQVASVLPLAIPATDYHAAGEPFRIVAHVFTIDPDDPLVPGFVLR